VEDEAIENFFLQSFYVTNVHERRPIESSDTCEYNDLIKSSVAAKFGIVSQKQMHKSL